MGDLEWAQGIQGVTQGALAGMQLNRQDEELRLKEKALGVDQLKPAREALRQAEQSLTQKMGEYESLAALSSLSEEQVKRRDTLQSEIQGLIAVVKGGTALLATGEMPAPRAVPQMAPGPAGLPPPPNPPPGLLGSVNLPVDPNKPTVSLNY